MDFRKYFYEQRLIVDHDHNYCKHIKVENRISNELENSKTVFNTINKIKKKEASLCTNLFKKSNIICNQNKTSFKAKNEV